MPKTFLTVVLDKLVFYFTMFIVCKRKLIYLTSVDRVVSRTCYPAGRRQTSFGAWLRFPPLHRISLAPERTILHLFRELFYVTSSCLA